MKRENEVTRSIRAWRRIRGVEESTELDTAEKPSSGHWTTQLLKWVGRGKTKQPSEPAA